MRKCLQTQRFVLKKAIKAPTKIEEINPTIRLIYIPEN